VDLVNAKGAVRKMRTVRLVGGPKHGEIVAITDRNDDRNNVINIPYISLQRLSYIRYRKFNNNIFVYDDGKERIKKARCAKIPYLATDELECIIRKEILAFFAREVHSPYEILSENYYMAPQGYRGDIEIYIHVEDDL
jgi:hypothetical protein